MPRFLPGCIRSPKCRRRSTIAGATILSLKDNAIDGFLKGNPAYAREVIAEDTYSGWHEKIISFGVHAVLVATAKLPAEDAYVVVKAVFEGLPAFRSMHPLLAALERKQMARDALVVPLHDGARRYYRENGLQEKAGRD